MKRPHNMMTLVGVRKTLTTMAEVMAYMDQREARWFLSELRENINAVESKFSSSVSAGNPDLWEQAIQSKTLSDVDRYAVSRLFEQESP